VQVEKFLDEPFGSSRFARVVDLFWGVLAEDSPQGKFRAQLDTMAVAIRIGGNHMNKECRHRDLFDTGTDRPESQWRITRRTFLTAAAGSVTGLMAASCAHGGLGALGKPVRFGMVTDPHYVDREPAGSRHYRESLAKMRECVELMNSEKVDLLVELGDFKDQDSPPVEERTVSHLRAIETEFARFAGPRFHALGNHDMDSLSKAQFLAGISNTGIPRDRSYYSSNIKGLHLVVLDANHRSDGSDYDHGNFDWTDANVPSAELAWLEKDLAEAPGPAVVFLHQRLDGEGNVFVSNAADVRGVLERSGKVLAVFQGHHHDGGYSCIRGIHYCTLKAMVEGSGAASNSYAIAEVHRDGAISVAGYRRAETRELAASEAAA
jgi:hypothetical protein